MGILGILGLGKQAGEVIASPIEAIGNVFDKLFTSDDEKEQAKFVLAKLKQEPQMLQGEINKLEAQHRSVFVAGWRPFVGWVCGISLGMFYIPQFAMATVLWVMKCWNASGLLPYPIQDISGLMELVLAMLGMAGFRTVEKLKDKTK